MKLKLIVIVLLCLFASSLASAVFPNFLTIATEKISQQVLNDAYEEEPIFDDKNYSASLSKVSVEKLNWFSSVNNLFEKFSNARVVDCQTLIEYNVQRVGGYNHADVETLSSSDTSKFKSVYGGLWSWVRRPVWVEINGIWVAGSINGMPHSYEYITDNNEAGHTCIHFYMSRTHGTDNLDAAHQEAVEYAYNHCDELNNFLKR